MKRGASCMQAITFGALCMRCGTTCMQPGTSSIKCQCKRPGPHACMQSICAAVSCMHALHACIQPMHVGKSMHVAPAPRALEKQFTHAGRFMHAASHPLLEWVADTPGMQAGTLCMRTVDSCDHRMHRACHACRQEHMHVARHSMHACSRSPATIPCMHGVHARNTCMPCIHAAIPACMHAWPPHAERHSLMEWVADTL